MTGDAPEFEPYVARFWIDNAWRVAVVVKRERRHLLVVQFDVPIRKRRLPDESRRWETRLDVPVKRAARVMRRSLCGITKGARKALRGL